MNHQQRSLATIALCVVGATAWGGNVPSVQSHAPDRVPMTVAEGRWAAELAVSGTVATLVIHDRALDRRYRLTAFEGTPVEGLHWLSPGYLEVDFPGHAALLHVRTESGTTGPTFHLVRSEFNVTGAGRVDYYSPPLVAHNDVRGGHGGNHETTQ